jgi:hypothetical protein
MLHNQWLFGLLSQINKPHVRRAVLMNIAQSSEENFLLIEHLPNKGTGREDPSSK